MQPTVTHPSSAGGAVTLTHWGVIRAQGADAATFLHGQLSNDVKGITSVHARLAAYCNAQGRMLASFVVTQGVAAPAGEAPELWLSCRADLLAATLKRLSMFVLRAKAKLGDASADIAVIGLVGQGASNWLAGQGVALDAAWSAAACAGGRVLRLPDAPGATRYLWLGASDQAPAVLAALPALDLASWDGLEISAGVVPVQAATVSAFVPQMLNYELVGGIDFKKGCYPGQEIVARSHYLGKLKRRGVVLSAGAEASGAQAGQEIWWSGDTGQPAGQVAQAAAVDGSWLLLAELKLAALGDAPEGATSTLHLGAIDGPVLTRQPLPYALPQEDIQPA
jgi:folate-binding protein YgfZ